MKLDQKDEYVQRWIRRYDREMTQERHLRLFGNSGFYNYGYWTAETRSQGEASANLVEKLLEWIPDRRGNILDVACGMGASTKLLHRYYAPENVVAVNYSEHQLRNALALAPGSDLMVMDGAKLAFADESFDNIICVEAAFHFNTRQEFFDEAFRLLKPGGRLVHSDILTRRRRRVPDNALGTPLELGERLRRAGFETVEVVDATGPCWQGFCNNLKRFPGEERRAKRLGLLPYVGGSIYSLGYRVLAGRAVQYYTLSCAQKQAAS